MGKPLRDTQEELHLLMRLQAEPELVLPQLMKASGPAVWRIVRDILGDAPKELLEECTSDVFVRLWQSAERFDSTRTTSPASWIYAIARHTALDARRKWKPTAGMIPLDEEELQMDLHLEENLVAKETAGILHEVIDEMPSPDREIFICRYYRENSIGEIAEQLQLTGKQVENRLYRCKERLRKKLMERGIGQ